MCEVPLYGTAISVLIASLNRCVGHWSRPRAGVPDTDRVLEQVRVLKVELDTLLDLNTRAPELERIDRGEIVVDAALRERIIATGAFF